ncbi:hypothetical protein [Curtobacterium sp. MCBD17_023]|uniref:hypothetical protein n=1 Tax=Curtobacterium sp. MCBD17_023 TaxID=2175657 RepID=UPI000D98F932|nr:hypothetical protein [Curtobacterium sp. MCBD17_023]PYY48280.1 hypothetical protein DEI84_09840 [Curtobacterium sp. MCBD17_023]
MKHSTVPTRAAAVAVGLALLTTLSACSGGDDPRPTTSPSASASSSASSSKPVSCKDGTAVVDQDGATVRLDGSCTSLEIHASNTQVTAGRDLERIAVSGDLNYVRAAKVDTVSFDAESEGNRIVTPSSPETDDQGRTNIVGPAPEGH